MKTAEQTKRAQEQTEKETAAAKILYNKLEKKHQEMWTRFLYLPINFLPNMRKDVDEMHDKLGEEMRKIAEIKNELFQIAFPKELFPLFGCKQNF